MPDHDPSSQTPLPPQEPVPVQPVLDYYSGREPQWVTLRTFSSMEAQLARLRLQDEGIPCSVADENMAILYSGLLTPVKLQVLDRDLERAQTILAQPARLDDDEEEYAEEAWRCPKCHRRTVSLLPLPAIWKWLCIPLLGLPAVFVTRRRRCENCGHEWAGHA